MYKQARFILHSAQLALFLSTNHCLSLVASHLRHICEESKASHSCGQKKINKLGFADWINPANWINSSQLHIISAQLLKLLAGRGCENLQLNEFRVLRILKCNQTCSQSISRDLLAEICFLNTPKYKNLFSQKKSKRFLYVGLNYFIYNTIMFLLQLLTAVFLYWQFYSQL